jgi:hypothetical protein
MPWYNQLKMSPETKTSTKIKFLGHTVFEKEETFEIKTYPKHIQQGLKKSNIPEEYYPVALAVIGKAFYVTKKLWGDRMADLDLNWKVPMISDFEQGVLDAKKKVSFEDLTSLSNSLFGSTNTSTDLVTMMNGEIVKILDSIHEKHT